MNFFQLSFTVLLTSFVFGADEDDVACVFNKFRQENGVEPFKISTILMQTAQEVATAGSNANKFLIMLPGDKNYTDRMTRAGYKHSSAYALGGIDYKTGKLLADSLVKYNPEHIKDPKLKHIGYAKSLRYSNIDFGASYSEYEPTRDPVCYYS